MSSAVRRVRPSAESRPYNYGVRTADEGTRRGVRRRPRDSSPSQPPEIVAGIGDLAELSLSALDVEEPFRTVLADPPWRFQNRTGKVAPEHK